MKAPRLASILVTACIGCGSYITYDAADAGEVGKDGSTTADASDPLAMDAGATDAGTDAKQGASPLIVAAGIGKTCAAKQGALKCWGDNTGGRLAVGTLTTPISTPAAVINMDQGVEQVATSEATCALKNGGVWCWGRNQFGVLGDGTMNDAIVPRSAMGLESGVKQITMGTNHACALTSAGKMKCWGAGLDNQLGQGGASSSSRPVDPADLYQTVTAISAGGSHTCAVMAGELHCWGKNDFKQLGIAAGGSGAKPSKVVGISGEITAVSCGSNHTCALAAGKLWCWGAGIDGQVGGTAEAIASPRIVAGLPSPITSFATGGRHTCVVAAGGLYCWGDFESGQLGLIPPPSGTSYVKTPTLVPGLEQGVTTVSASELNTCAIHQGVTKCWGNNAYRQVGIGATSGSVSTPATVLGL